MKVLYAIQGTGNGHVSRAREIIPILNKYASVDVLISGIQADVELEYSIQYQFYGLSFIFGKNGGIDIWQTIKKFKPIRLIREIMSLQLSQYDLIINDFEPVSAWACVFRFKKCIGLSHQSSVIHPFSPRPQKFEFLSHLILKYYAPSKINYGFHFRRYSENTFTPVIRKEIRNLKPKKGDYYTVYLPAYSDERIAKVLMRVEAKFQVFTKHSNKKYNRDNIEFTPINNTSYLKSLESSLGLICGAGFEGPAEALFLKKKLLVIPMMSQYEQKCNAAALEEMGVSVLKKLSLKYISDIENFILQQDYFSINYENETEDILVSILHQHIHNPQLISANSRLSFS
ncbi:glycosyltransferase family protein [Marivirga arenosa]|uniref:Glycosyltransferase family protein n=1 Tax=Marivirga arenosa TaxID=3059076 RepID=A0AA51ZVD6_9BACT|nr:glycosyltransferase family protein [Marivirga sp. BKB1-2]WNB17448.1 glycosyltransferase family protein [Marivirga sp. BKB1-2]